MKAGSGSQLTQGNANGVSWVDVPAEVTPAPNKEVTDLFQNHPRNLRLKELLYRAFLLLLICWLPVLA
jgi:hypothetical protein